MDNKNSLMASILVAVIALLAGLGLVFGMGLVVQNTVTPINTSMQMILVNQKALEKKFDDSKSSEVEALKKRVADLETALNQMRMMVGSALRAQQPASAQPAPQVPPQEDMNKVHDLPIDGSYVFGKPEAPATIVNFTDYQCPFCARFNPGARDVVKAMPDKVKLVIKHYPLPFHPMAKSAAKAAMAAGLQGKFYEMSELIFQNAADLSEAKFQELAKQAGVNLTKFNKDLKDKDAEFEKKIQADMALAVKAEVRGTPTYFLNGKKTSARDLESWKREVEAVTGAKK